MYVLIISLFFVKKKVKKEKNIWYVFGLDMRSKENFIFALLKK